MYVKAEREGWVHMSNIWCMRSYRYKSALTSCNGSFLAHRYSDSSGSNHYLPCWCNSTQLAKTTSPLNRRAYGNTKHAQINQDTFKNTHMQEHIHAPKGREKKVLGYICSLMLDRSAVHLWTIAVIVTAEALICQEMEICGWQMDLDPADHVY